MPTGTLTNITARHPSSFGQDSAGEDPAREAGRRDGAVPAHRAVARRPFLVAARDEGQDRGRDDRRRQPLTGPRRDEHRRIAGEPADERAQGEHRQSGDEHALATEEVAEMSTDEQEAAEEQRVCPDHPGQLAIGESEVALDRRQRHVHDGEVEDQDELRHAQERQ